MASKPDVTIIIPAYNEEGRIVHVINGIKRLERAYEIIVVDDGSTDNTYKLANGTGVRVISHPYNKGNGAAVKTGIRSAEGDIVVIIDADGQHEPKHIADMLSYFPGYDAVIGARAGESMSLGRRMANKVYNLLGTYLSGQKIRDLTSGFRAFKKDVIIDFLPLLPNSFSAPATSTLALIKAGYSVKFIPIQTEARTKGRSKIRVSDGLRFFLIILRVATFFSPLRIFLPVSLLCLIAGLIYGSYTLISIGRFTNMTMLLLSTSVIVFMLGLVAEQVAALRFSLMQEHQKRNK